MKYTAFVAIVLVSTVRLAMAETFDRGSFEFDGRSLSFFCVGHGGPLLILEAPSGISNEEAFANIIVPLSAKHKICAYERAFYGQSAPLARGETQSLINYFDELTVFLDLLDPNEPVVLLGYSYVGWVSRVYASKYPHRVAGLVLIDSPHVQWMRRMKEQMSPEDWDKVQAIFDWFVEHRGHNAWQSQFEMEAAADLPDKMPVAVITRAQDHERMRFSGISEAAARLYNDIHFELAPDLLRLTKNTIAFTAAESQHYIPDSEPEIVLEAVRSISTFEAPNHSDRR